MLQSSGGSATPPPEGIAISVCVRLRPPPADGLTDRRNRTHHGCEIVRVDGSTAWKWSDKRITYQEPADKVFVFGRGGVLQQLVRCHKLFFFRSFRLFWLLVSGVSSLFCLSFACFCLPVGVFFRLKEGVVFGMRGETKGELASQEGVLAGPNCACTPILEVPKVV